MKRKILAFTLLAALIIASVLQLSACKSKYEPQESSAEEKRTVMTLSLDGEEYDVAYELYRAFFLQLKSSVDMGNSDVWTGPQKDTYVEKIDKLISERICDIYSVFHLCEKVGINAYSKEVDNLIDDYITVAVEGGTIDGEYYKGYEGDYAAYLNSLKEMYLNYSVQELLIRYSIALEKLNEYYIGNLEGESFSGGKLQYTKDDVKDFYFDSSKARRMIRAYLSADAFTEKRANEIRDSIAAKKNESEVVNYIIGFTTSGATDIKNGELVGRYSLDRFYYSELTECIFSLDVGKTGPVIRLDTDYSDGYTIIYRTEATNEHFEDCYEDIVNVYLLDRVGEMLASTATQLESSISYTDTLKNLDRALVTIQ